MDIETVKRFMPDLNDDQAALYIALEKAAEPIREAAGAVADPVRANVLNVMQQTIALIVRQQPAKT